MNENAPSNHPRSSRKILVAGVAVAAAIGVAVLAASPVFRPAPQTVAGSPVGSAVGSAVAAPSASVASRPPLGAREKWFEFGAISMAAGKVSHRYWIRNESTAPLEIKRIYTSCMCTTASFVKSARQVGTYGMPGHGPLPPVNETLAPDEAAYIDVVFDPAAHGPSGLGRTERMVTIEHAGGTALKLGFSADVRP